MRSKRVSVALWVVQGLLAALFLFAGVMKFVMPVEAMQHPVALPGALLHFVGACEIAGALGLVLPGVTRIATGLTPLAAAGLVIIMVGATAITAATMSVGQAAVPFVVGALAATIAWSRWRVAPLAPAGGV